MEELETQEEVVAPEATEEVAAIEEAPEAELAPNEPAAEVTEEPAAEEIKVVKKSKKAAEPEVPVVAPVVSSQPVANPARVNNINGLQISIK